MSCLLFSSVKSIWSFLKLCVKCCSPHSLISLTRFVSCFHFQAFQDCIRDRTDLHEICSDSVSQFKVYAQVKGSVSDMTFCFFFCLLPLYSQSSERRWEFERVFVLFVFKGATSYHTAQEIWVVAHFK